MVKNMRIINKNLLFGIAFSLYVLCNVLLSSYYSVIISDNMEDIIKVVIITIIIIEMFVGKRLSLNTVFLISTFAVGGLIVYLRSDISEALVIAFLVIGASNIDIILAVKQGLAVYIITSVIIVLSSLAGVIPNDMFIRGNHSQQVVYAYGFYGYATIPYAVFMFNILYALIIKKINLKDFLIWIAFDLIIFYMFNNRLMFLLEMLFYMIWWIFKNKRIYEQKIYKRIGVLLPWILAAVSVGASYFLDLSNPVMYFINNLLSWRLYYGKKGIEMYSIGLFGQYVEMRGNLAVGRQSEMSYFYIDCGYIHSLLRYGLVFFLVILTLYSLIGYYAAMMGDKILFCILIVILFGNCINNLWISLDINPILLFSFAAIQGIRRYKINCWNKKLSILY